MSSFTNTMRKCVRKHSATSHFCCESFFCWLILSPLHEKKVKVISRCEEELTAERKTDLRKVHRNFDPSLHPFEKGREYTRALNSVKLDKLFAKPFIAALDGHSDGVFTMCKHPSSLSTLISGSCDGELRVWNLSTRQTLLSIPAHNGFVRGIGVALDGKTFFSCGADSTVKQWAITPNNYEELTEKVLPITTYLGNNAFTGMDHSYRANMFATCGNQLDIWDEQRSAPVTSLSWGCDSLLAVKFNPVEGDIVVSTATDRNIVIYDIRASTPIKKLVMQMRTNALCWNPMEVFNFSTANEDHNCYTFDMRKLEQALNVHQDHVSAVLDLDYSPTGTEFVAGSYDRTIRIFPIDSGHSREVYHTKRMQRIFTVRFSADSKFVLSGSDDTNIRIWKANASEPLQTLTPREKQKLDYSKKLKERYGHLPQLRRIARHRHLPKAVHNAKKLKVIMKNSERRKEQNRRAHSVPDKNTLPERKKHIVETES